ncbi:lysozyme [Pseudomonas phage Skulduggery]|uniref:Lysozyme n=1 Tax=Pseudomonas phage Skulduggery TaxID=2006671 RepID=A0A1Y0T0U4_9CAUD|nr:lysozyme [Pseudomonas phage Skulduggery]ARV77128.1 lysozyme [Pseudomonas phage Skulduggery]
MPFITPEQAGGQNVCAILDMISFAEGTNRAGYDGGYNAVVTGIDGKLETFGSYADHPFAGGRKSKTINSKGLTSNASGRYQQMLKDWPHYKKLLKLPDFGKLSQDILAIQHIKECRALDDAKAGRVREVIRKCANIWASLPGNTYGQPTKAVEALVQAYRAAGGVVNG